MMDKETELQLAGDWAGLVAYRHGGPVEAFVSSHRLSSRFSFRADEATLLVALAKTLKKGDADKALAYGLAHAGARDLWLVLPEESVGSTRERLAFIETKVRLFAVGEGGPAEVVPLAASEVLTRPGVDLATGELVLGDRQRWVQVLIDWAESIPGLRAAHRGSYLAWHCDGRLVLKIRRTRGGLVASAGVHYGKPTGDQMPPVTVDLAGDATALDQHRLIAAASGAAAARLDGSDSGHGEHRLQSMLTARDLGLVHMVRELAIRRPGRRPRYVDFVGVDQRGDIHVVETKIGNAEMLVLQGLDYWIWAQTHLDILATHFGLTGTLKVRLGRLFQLTNRRTYDEHLGDLNETPLEAGCPFRYANQPMRNVALARALLAAGETDRATVCRCSTSLTTEGTSPGSSGRALIGSSTGKWDVPCRAPDR